MCAIILCVFLLKTHPNEISSAIIPLFASLSRM